MTREEFCEKRWIELKEFYSENAKINYQETKQFELDNLDDDCEYNNTFIYAYLGFIEEAIGNFEDAKRYYEKSYNFFRDRFGDDDIHTKSIKNFLQNLEN